MLGGNGGAAEDGALGVFGGNGGALKVGAGGTA
jgi:hypothetical protein